MGGNAFNNVSRIARDDIEPTIRNLVAVLDHPYFTVEYATSNFLGSVGKQATSGDIDIALDHKVFSISDLRAFNNRLSSVLGVHETVFRPNGNFLTCSFPIHGKSERIQIDFLIGSSEWLKFTHFSAGEKSNFKGMWRQIFLCSLALFTRDYTLYRKGELIAGVKWCINLEHGLHRMWTLKLRKGDKYPSSVDPDYWETHLPIESNPPRFSRVGFIDVPSDCVRILFGEDVTVQDIETFEGLCDIVNHHVKQGRIKNIKGIINRTNHTLVRSNLKHDMSENDIRRVLESRILSV